MAKKKKTAPASKVTPHMNDDPLFSETLIKIKSANETSNGKQTARVEDKVFIFYFGTTAQKESIQQLKSELLPWQMEHLKKSKGEVAFYTGVRGPIFIIQPQHPSGPSSHQGLLNRSLFQAGRDLVGGMIPRLKSMGPSTIEIAFHGAQEEEMFGAVVGLEMGAYSYLVGNRRKLEVLIHWPDGFSKGLDVIRQGQNLGRATNLSRHYTNLPPSHLNPVTFADSIKKLFNPFDSMTIDIWDEKKLREERMGLLLAVGMGSDSPPRFVHLKYRPKGKASARANQPIAFVGKGVTFDTGGLDLKPSSAMRLMKKDMGGAAAVVGLAHWIASENLSQPCDFYLALAENSVSDRAFRPSDVVQSRNGYTVEIHNTDAEGRLILADAIDVAVTQKGSDEPSGVINVATLTGAIKVALGSGVAGLFSNSDEWADQLLKSSQARGDRAWRMPLVPEYFGNLQTPFADFQNCSDGFGGAVIAALFLEKFVRQKPWIHLDIFAWKDKPEGAWAEPGGSGQSVQALAHWLRGVSK